MRGKKIDNEFLTEFITFCSSNNKCLPQEIINEAKKEIEIIEQKIKEVESLKIKRSKLLDVITIFNSEKKIVKQDDLNLLQYFNIENQHICKFICDLLTDNSFKINEIKSDIFSQNDILYCIKQLLEYKVIYKVDDCILRGIKYNEYYKVVLGK